MDWRDSPVVGESPNEIMAFDTIPQPVLTRRVYKMWRTTEHDERTIRYLLGDLPETEQTAVEQEYFVDPEKFEEVWATENDLVDGYVRGRLSRRERELFERNYL